MFKKIGKKISSVFAGCREDMKTQLRHAAEHKGKAVLSVLVVLLIIAGCGAALAYGKVHSYFAKSNYVESTEQETEVEPTPTPEIEIDPEMKEIYEKMELYEATGDILQSENVYNVLLVGLDRTATKKYGNSDSMILVSINFELKQVSMISLMRDTFVDIPGVGYRKLNAAYNNGGADLLLETVTENYRVQIDRYMLVAMKDMINIINTIGTITLHFTDAEANNANTTMLHMCQNMGLEDMYEEWEIPGEGTYQCNGMQAVAYARIRKVGNADYERTERQREVLSKLIQQIRVMKISDIDKLANELLPFVTHNIPESEFWGLLGKVPVVMNFSINKSRLPYDGLYYSQNGNLVPDWESTYVRLQEELYGIKNDCITEENAVY